MADKILLRNCIIGCNVCKIPSSDATNSSPTMQILPRVNINLSLRLPASMISEMQYLLAMYVPVRTFPQDENNIRNYAAHMSQMMWYCKY